LDSSCNLDLRYPLFKTIKHKKFRAHLIIEKAGCIAGINRTIDKITNLGIKVQPFVSDGSYVMTGKPIMEIIGDPVNLAKAEDMVIGNLSKSSGIASAAYAAVTLAGGKIQIVSGGWKKMPLEIKEIVRQAVALGGALPRICEESFVYLDKNYVRMFGSIPATLAAAAQFTDMIKVIQVKGDTASITEEAVQAVEGGANIIMIDTGVVEHVSQVATVLKEIGVRERIKLAFAGGIKLSDIPSFISMGIDILDIGAEIVDAPALGMKLDIIDYKGVD